MKFSDDYAQKARNDYTWTSEVQHVQFVARIRAPFDRKRQPHPERNIYLVTAPLQARRPDVNGLMRGLGFATPTVWMTTQEVTACIA